MKHLLLLFVFIFSINITIAQQWWAEQTSGVTTALTSVSVAEQSYMLSKVWVCGYSGVVLRTTNSGTNWISVGANGIPNTTQLINVCAIDGNTAIVSGYLSTNTWAWKTTNAGANWTQVFAQTGGFVDGVVFRPGSTTECVLVGDPVGSRWAIFRSTNAGSTWDSAGCFLPQNAAEGGYNNSLYWSRFSGAQGDSGLWFGTNNSRIYHSRDRGFTWLVESTGSELNSYTVGFFNYSGLFAGANLYGSSNFGYSWSQVTGALGTGNFGGIVGFGAPVDEALFPGLSWYVRSDNKIYRGVSNYTVEYSAPTGNYRHIGTHDYGGPIWAIRDNGGISACVACNVSGVSPLSSETPTKFSLGQNYPNPFNPVTTFEFSVPTRSYVKICVYSSIGQLAEVISEGVMNAGSFGVNWNASKLSSGVYYYSLIAKDEVSSKTFTDTKKMVLVK
jgi:photosystem II stability/assembly factor-like uncharacterized protein